MSDELAGGTMLAERPATPPAPGELKIREKRSWRNWQLVAAAGVMFLAGLYVESLSHVKPAPAVSSGYKLPPPATGGQSSNATATTVAGAGSAAATQPGSEAAGSTATSTPAADQVAIILLPRYPAGTGGTTGNWTSPSFTVSTGTWDIGWAYACTGSNPSFQVMVGPSNSVAVTGTSTSGQGVTPQSSSGTFTLAVQATAACYWAVKVTGVGTPAS